MYQRTPVVDGTKWWEQRSFGHTSSAGSARSRCHCKCRMNAKEPQENSCAQESNTRNKVKNITKRGRGERAMIMRSWRLDKIKKQFQRGGRRGSRVEADLAVVRRNQSRG